MKKDIKRVFTENHKNEISNKLKIYKINQGITQLKEKYNIIITIDNYGIPQNYICDICHKTITISWSQFLRKLREKKPNICHDCTSSLKIQAINADPNHINPFNTQEGQAKARASIRRIYHCDNISQDSNTKIKKEETSIKNFGVPYHLQNPKEVEKLKASVQDTHHVDNISQLAFVKDAKEKAATEKYGEGVINVFQAEEVKDEIRKRNLENIGVENPGQIITTIYPDSPYPMICGEDAHKYWGIRILYFLPRNIVIHHINQNKKDYRLHNLLIMTRKLHGDLHGLLRSDRIKNLNIPLEVWYKKTFILTKDFIDEYKNIFWCLTLQDIYNWKIKQPNINPIYILYTMYKGYASFKQALIQ